MRARLARCVAATVFMFPTLGQAGDGVIEINHARALQGGISNVDAPGYPVTLNSGGSYILTSDLIPRDDLGAIEITNSRETASIDLNGFMINGLSTCFQAADLTVSCPRNPAQIPTAIVAPDAHVRVHNGAIIGFPGGGIQAERLDLVDVTLRHLGFGARADVLNATGVRIELCADLGLAGVRGLVRDSMATAIGGPAFRVGAGTVRDSEASMSRFGFLGTGQLIVHRCHATRCTRGFQTIKLLTDSYAELNQEFGVFGVFAARGLISQNNGDDGRVGRAFGPNVCGAGDCTP